LIAACSSSPSAQTVTTESAPQASDAQPATTASTVAPTSTSPSTSIAPAVTMVPVDPTQLIPIALGNRPFPADGDELATLHHGFTGDPNAVLQSWLVSPMAVPSGPDVRLLGFARTVGISSTTATFLTGPIDPQTALANLEASLTPRPTYVVTPSMRTEGTVTIRGFDAQPTTVQGDPPGWTVEASAVDQLGIISIKRSDYAFDKVVPTFSDLPPALQSQVLNPDAIAVNVGGALTSIGYEYGVDSLGDVPAHRTRLGYAIASPRAQATADLSALLTSGWDIDDAADAVTFTSTTTSEVWTLVEDNGATHLTYDTGS
jgi:hypothetical protein